MFDFFKTKTDTINEQDKLRELDLVIFDIFLKPKKPTEKLDKKKAKNIIKDLKSFATDNK